ncbi:MAG: TonB-dependent receptor, partial [Ideonella sp.]
MSPAVSCWTGAAGVLFASISSAAVAQATDLPAARLAPVVVTATRTEALAFDLPASISRIDGTEVRDANPQFDISESLAGVPGLLVRDRQNHAQDVQLSVRGFGARSTFGIRGVRLYVDGIPATLPDGQGQISHVELGSVGRIEVLRGPFSALYGNSAGGVVQVFTVDPAGPPSYRFDVSAGSDGGLRVGAQAQGETTGGIGYVVGASRFTTDGYRDHSATERTLGNAKLVWKPDADNQLTLVVNNLALPQAQDPLGLSRAAFESAPRSAEQAALDYDTRKQINQTQLGLTYQRRIDASNSLQVMVYGGHRGLEQYQSIPKAAQGGPLSPGGMIELDRDYRGIDLRWSASTRLADRPLNLVAGVSFDSLAERRRGFQNFIGSTLGVRGALRRDENNGASSFDQYLQATSQLSPGWALTAGVRHSRIRFDTRDAYVVGSNPDDSGRAAYQATLPVLGVVHSLSSDVNVYVTAGRGFETPTLNELAYRGDGRSGFNLGLQAARSSSIEAGLKSRSPAWGDFELAAFRTGTDNEIVTQTNLGGRSTFQNAGSTRRTGLEASWVRRYAGDLQARVAATLIEARFVDGFLTCTAAPCANPNLAIAAGNRIPGV